MEMVRSNSYQLPAGTSQLPASGLIPPIVPSLREYRQISVSPYPSIPPVGRGSLLLEDLENGARMVGTALAGVVTTSSHDGDDSSDDESSVSSHNPATSFMRPQLAIASAAAIGFAGAARTIRRQLDHERVTALDERTRVSKERIEDAEFTAANAEITQKANIDALNAVKEQHRFIEVQLQHQLTAYMANREAYLQHARDRDQAQLQREAMQHEVVLATQQREERSEERAQQANERLETMRHEAVLAGQQSEQRQMTTSAECFRANQQLMASLVDSFERIQAGNQALFTQALAFATQVAERGAVASNAVAVQEEAPRITSVPSRFAHLEQVLSQHSFLPLLAINQPLHGLTVYRLLVEKQRLSQSVGDQVQAQFELAMQIYSERLTQKGKTVTLVHVINELLQCRKQHWMWKWVPQIFLGASSQPNERLELSNFIIKCLSEPALSVEQAEWILTELLAMYVNVARFFILK